LIRHFLSREFVNFLATGAAAAAVNFGTRIVFNRWMSFSLAVVLAYLAGMVTAFVLAKLFVFRQSAQPLHRSVAFFVLVNLAALLQTWLVSMGLAYYLLPALGVEKGGPEIAHGVGVMVPAFTSYLGHKRWSFR
jgi:putative flippase GtrA